MWHVVSIDDLAETRELIRLALNHPDITLNLAADGAQGLDIIRDSVPDLVMLDLMLPRMNGWEVYEAIRTDEKLSHIPILILSVLSPDKNSHPDFGRTEIDHYLRKPFDIEFLRGEIERILKTDTLWS